MPGCQLSWSRSRMLITSSTVTTTLTASFGFPWSTWPTRCVHLDSCQDLPANGQLPYAVDRTISPEGEVGRRRSQGQCWEPLQQRWQRDRHLEPGELLAEAPANAMRDGHV